MPAPLASYPLVAFVVVGNPDVARSFYRDKLGLKLLEEQLPFALVFDVHGVMLRVTMAFGPVSPARHTVLGWHVPDIAEAVKDLNAAGIEMQRYDGMQQDELGIWTTPTGSKVAWFRDPDGNVLSVSQA
jgi:catechol 2,3-dioxygenase-like lactoylglutathione lyase family enzyme